MLERLLGKDSVSILQCQDLAKNAGFDSMPFELHGPKGMKKAKWLDAYMGLFEIEGLEGFVHIKDFKYIADITCKNLGVEEEEPQ